MWIVYLRSSIFVLKITIDPTYFSRIFIEAKFDVFEYFYDFFYLILRLYINLTSWASYENLLFMIAGCIIYDYH